MNLKNAKKIVSAYKLACSDGVPPTNNFDWQPSPMGYKIADLMIACRMLGTSVEELQKESMPKAEEPKKAEPKKVEPKKAVAPKKVEPKVEPKISVPQCSYHRCDKPQAPGRKYCGDTCRKRYARWAYKQRKKAERKHEATKSSR